MSEEPQAPLPRLNPQWGAIAGGATAVGLATMLLVVPEAAATRSLVQRCLKHLQQQQQRQRQPPPPQQHRRQQLQRQQQQTCNANNHDLKLLLQTAEVVQLRRGGCSYTS
ncbi:hypothetical protein ABPG77_001105 [Micractinium sp. CCAP 211/92]